MMKQVQDEKVSSCCLGGKSDDDYVKCANVKVTWEDVDDSLKLEELIYKVNLVLKTSERRLFALTASYDYIYTLLTTIRCGNNKQEWCPESACSFLIGLSNAINGFSKRVDYFKRLRHKILNTTPTVALYNRNLLSSRREEVSDPDRIIWERLHKHGLSPDKVMEAYEDVEHLLPNEFIKHSNLRTGLVSDSSLFVSSPSDKLEAQRLTKLSEFNDAINMNTRDFYNRYVRSDELVAPSNPQSKQYSETCEVIPGMTLKVPRRTERYLNGEFQSLVGAGQLPPSNYIRGLIIAYHVGKLFGAAFTSANLYQRGFALAASYEASQFEPVTGFVLMTPVEALMKKKGFPGMDVRGESSSSAFSDTIPFSKVKNFALKTTKHRKVVDSDGDEKFKPVHVPARVLREFQHKQHLQQHARSVLVSTASYVHQRKDKLSIQLMRSPLAEESARGPLAMWFAARVANVIGRCNITPNYALLLLLNWAARLRNDHDPLRALSALCGISSHMESGMVIPTVGFGSGMTGDKLKRYTKMLFEGVVGKSIFEKKKLALPPLPFDASDSLEEMSTHLFIDNGVIDIKEYDKKHSDGSSCTCDCHDEASSMVGKVFEPSPERRSIREYEYGRALSSQLRLSFSFGVCGYQHPLAASSDKKTLVESQLNKQRLVFIQREVATAVNFSRLLQYIFTAKINKECNGVDDALSNLTSLPRQSIERLSRYVKESIPCERFMDDICVKFNADMLPLGTDASTFIKKKVGMFVLEHAKDCLSVAFHFNDRCKESSNMNNWMDTPYGKHAINLATKCVTGCAKENEYNIDRPFLFNGTLTYSSPLTGGAGTDNAKSKRKRSVEDKDDTTVVIGEQNDASKRFYNIPFFGIQPIVDVVKHRHTEDKTAIRSDDSESSFWVEMDNKVFMDALIAKNVISVPLMKKNNISVTSPLQMGSYLDILHELKENNEKEVAADKPRKSDPTPWSSKNTGQSGRSTTEFSPNSLIVVYSHIDVDEVFGQFDERVPSAYDCYGLGDIFLGVVESQRNTAHNDINYPQTKPSKCGIVTLIEAPHISPVYRHGGKTQLLQLKHT